MADVLPDDSDSKVRQLYDYWRSIRPDGRRLPGRQHFDPIDIPHLLSALWLLDVFHDPLRFRYRLISAAHVAVTGTDRTGRWYDEAHPQYKSSPLYAKLAAAATQGAPTFRRGRPTVHIDKDYMSLETLLLPLARDGETVDMLLGITIYHRVPAQESDTRDGAGRHVAPPD